MAQLAHGAGSAADEWPGWQNEFNATSSDTVPALPQERREGKGERERTRVEGREFRGRQDLPFRTTDDQRNPEPTGH